jgi:hypothetical protein
MAESNDSTRRRSLRYNIKPKGDRMEKWPTWLAIAGVAVGFVVLGWLLFSDNDKNKK